MSPKEPEISSPKILAEYSEEIIQELFNVKLPPDWKILKKEEKSELLLKWAREAFPNVPDSLIPMTVGLTVDGDSGISMDQKPDWLDHEKFLRGQKFAQDNIFGLYFSVLLTLFSSMSFEEGFKPLVASKQTSEPYKAFKRYLSTGKRVRNWYTTDPWTKGTPAYNDMRAVRQGHVIVRRKANTMSAEELTKAATIENSLSPTTDVLLEDFRSGCPVTLPGQCPFAEKSKSSVQFLRMHQCEMACAQGGFFCLGVLCPEAIGIHDIKQRSRDFLNLWIKANLRNITPEFEHMMRCLTIGTGYYFTDISYEVSLLYFAELMDIEMPRLRSLLSYSDWIRHKLAKFLMYYVMRVPQVKKFLNWKFHRDLNNALNFSSEKHAELQEKSDKVMKSAISKNNSTMILSKIKVFDFLWTTVLLFFVFYTFILKVME
ncbi:hypothetical protein G9C98_006162 [Cotesia typhae]|uniref:ER-bound oxygenase mpaB/mpaB'/Rubber oxygenase catalytic domain-containing protein n=1 Tax=Cotesia typhae TaxID=2053667 RepID=A0A8J5RCF6_9HYME|nr:hypothetical protein G9C98_006162 [Cotesia typhae]